MTQEKEFKNNLKKGRCKHCESAKPVSGSGWTFLGCYHEPYKGKWVAEIKDCPKEVSDAERN